MTDPAFDSKLAVVTSWLQTVYKERPVPEFEINEQTISALYELALKNKRRNNEQQIIINNNNKLAQEYQMEANRKEKLLEGLGLKRDKLSTSNSGYQSPYQRLFELSELLAHLTVLLGAHNSTLTVLTSSLYHQRSEYSEQIRFKTDLEQHLTYLQTQSKAALEDFTQAKRLLQQLEDAQANQLSTVQSRLKNLKYLESKSQEYEQTLAKLKEQLKSTGVTPELYHQSLKQMHVELTRIKQEAAPKLGLLKGYHQLPPDLTLAQVKIEEAKQELLALEEQLSRSVNELQLNAIE